MEFQDFSKELATVSTSTNPSAASVDEIYRSACRYLLTEERVAKGGGKITRRRAMAGLAGAAAGILGGTLIKDIFSGSEGKPIAETTSLRDATSIPPKATSSERQATATPPTETPTSRAPATSTATSTTTAASTETATATATITPEKIAQKRNVMKEIILPKFTDTVKRRREEKSKKDPDFLSRVDSDLNRDRVNMLFTGIGKEGSLTDSILLVSYHVPTNKMSLISFPRDLQSPEVMKKSGSAGSSRINQTLSFGGIDLAKLTIENATGLSVDFAVVEKFDTLIDLVNKTVGEIEIDLKEPINDPQYPALTGNGFDPLHITAGKHRVNGETALKIARSRLSTSDYDRAGRQQLVLRSLLREWVNYGGRDILRAIPLLNRIQSTVQQKIDSKSLQLDFDINHVAWSQIQALTASMPQVMADKVRGTEWEMGEEPESDSYVISNKNFIVSADIPGVAITKIKGGNPYTANPRQDYWRAVRESVKAFLTKDDGARVDIEQLSSPNKEQRILRPQELSYPEVERWIGKLRGTHDSVLSESLFTKEIAAMPKAQREKVLDAIAEAHADALIERYGDSEAIIGLDPGHGGHDRGSSGASREGTIYEENLTWDLANRIAEKIFTKTSGRYHSVILRPEEPVDEDIDGDGNISAIESIQKRKALLMEVEEKLRPNPQDRGKNIVYLSIHTNGAPDPNSNISGTEIYWPNQKGEANERYRTSSKSLAQGLQSKLIKYIRDAGYNVYDRGAKEDPDSREPAGNSETTRGPYIVLGSPKLDRKRKQA